MMSKRIMVFLSMLAGDVIADELPSIDEFLINLNTKYFCSNVEYTSCMQITRNNCIKSYKSAINLCMSNKDSKLSIPSPVCIANNYAQNINVIDKIMQSCEYIAAKMVEKYNLMHIPTKSLNSDAQ